MRVKVVFSLSVLLILFLGLNNFLIGAELVDFQKNVNDFKNDIGNKNTVIKEVEKAASTIREAYTEKEKAEAYTKYAETLAESIVNYKRAEKSVGKVLEDLDSGLNFGKDGKVSIQEELKNYAIDINDVYNDIDNVISNFDLQFDGADPG